MTTTCRFPMRVLSGLLVMLTLWQMPVAYAADDSNVWTVPKLNAGKPWDSFVGAPKIRVEGRVTASSGSRFRLQGCEAVFVISNEKTQLKSAKSYVEVKGQFRKDGMNVVFAVDDVKVVPSFAQQFDLKASRLLRPTVEEWTALGNWGQELAKFYEDPELAEKANGAFLKAIELEFRALKPTNFAGRYELAAKMAEQNLSPRRRLEILHEGCRIEWAVLKRVESEDLEAFQQFAAKLKERLPGADVPSTTSLTDADEKYLQEPDLVYREASNEKRTRLHRVFYVSVMRNILLHDKSEDGSNGDAIATQIDNLIPEEHALADSLRLQQLDYRLRHITVATRTEAESLAEALRVRQQPDAARRALTEWVKSHESRLRAGGLVGLIELADEYQELLHNRTAAVECLKEAHRIDPTFEDVRKRLSEMGYILQNGRWIKANQIPTLGKDSPVVAGISLGMSASALRSLMGQPRSVSRMITARGSTEVWSFGALGTTPLVIRLQQQSGETEPKVAAISGE